MDITSPPPPFTDILVKNVFVLRRTCTNYWWKKVFPAYCHFKIILVGGRKYIFSCNFRMDKTIIEFWYITILYKMIIFIIQFSLNLLRFRYKKIFPQKKWVYFYLCFPFKWLFTKRFYFFVGFPPSVQDFFII